MTTLSTLTPEEYLIHLEELRNIVLQLPSPPSSPSSSLDDIGTSTTANVTELRKQAQEALTAAQCNPADGRWAILSRVLSMPCTRGHYRWIGLSKEGDVDKANVNMVNVLPSPPSLPVSQVEKQGQGQEHQHEQPQEESRELTPTPAPTPTPLPPIGTTTEAEWEAWERAERKKEEEARMMMKVERWRGRVAVLSITGNDTDAEEEGEESMRPEPSSSVPVPFFGPGPVEDIAVQEEEEAVHPIEIEALSNVNTVEREGDDSRTEVASPTTKPTSKEPTILVPSTPSPPQPQPQLQSQPQPQHQMAKPTLQPSLTLSSSYAGEGEVLSNNAPFGFNVIKRGSSALVGANGKPKVSESTASARRKEKMREVEIEERDLSRTSSSVGKGKGKEKEKEKANDDVPVPTPRATLAKPPSKGQQQKKMIADISEMSFLPPSFPSSDLHTSTPKLESKGKERERKKPALIKPLPADSSSPVSASALAPVSVQSPQHQLQQLSSNPFTTSLPRPPPLLSSPAGPSRVHEQPSSSFSFDMPSSPLQHRVKPPSKGKRARSPEREESNREGKKARLSTAEEEPNTPRNSINNSTSVEGSRKALPTLTELLASSKKDRKGNMGKRVERRASLVVKKLEVGGKGKGKGAEKEAEKEKGKAKAREKGKEKEKEKESQNTEGTAKTTPKKMMNVTQMAGRFKPPSAPAPTTLPVEAKAVEKGKGRFKPASSSSIPPPGRVGLSMETHAERKAKEKAKSTKFKPVLTSMPSPAPERVPAPVEEVSTSPTADPSKPTAASSKDNIPTKPTPTTTSRSTFPTTSKPVALASSKSSIFPTPSSPPLSGLLHENDIFAEVDHHHYLPPSHHNNRTHDPFSLENEPDPFALTGVDYDTSSPTKSLSSLAGDSDEEDELHEEQDEVELSSTSFVSRRGEGFRYKGIESFDSSHSFSVEQHRDISFNPPFASTQVNGGFHSAVSGGGKFGGGWLGYSSQLVDVDQQVNEVDKLLEKDVDYDGWLRDPSLEPDEV